MTDAAQLKTVEELRLTGICHVITTLPPQLTAVAPNCSVGPSYVNGTWHMARGTCHMAHGVLRLQRGSSKTKLAFLMKS